MKRIAAAAVAVVLVVSGCQLDDPDKSWEEYQACRLANREVPAAVYENCHHLRPEIN